MAIPISLQGKVALGAAAFGAYQGDILNDPLGGTLNAGIFGATATLMKITPTNLKEAGEVPVGLGVDPDSVRQRASLGMTEADAKAVQRVRNKMIQLESNLKYQAGVEAKYQRLLAERAQYPTNARTKRIRRLDKRIATVQNQLQLSTASGLDAFSSEVSLKLKQFGIHLGGSFADLKSFASGISDANTANKLLSLMRQGTPYSASSMKKALNQASTYKATIQTTDKQAAEKALAEYFKTKLNNSDNIANLKAQEILKRTIIGQDILIKDHTVSFVDSISKNRISLPLTAETAGGVFYHAPNSNTFFAVSGTNPYTEALTRKNTPVSILGTGELRPVGLSDVMERMHPELMILQAYEGKDIEPGLDLIRKQLHHSEQEGATQLRQSSTLNDADVSARFRAYGTSTNRGIILNTNGVGQTDPDQPLRAMNVVSTHAGAMSEAKAANIALQEAMLEQGISPEFMKQGLSLNNIHGTANTSFQTIAPLNMEQRAVVNRATKATHQTDAYKQMAQVYGDDFLKQFESSVMINKMDVLDKATFNTIVSSQLGSEFVLSDGAGLFNLRDSDLFEHGLNQTVKISSQKNGSLILEDKQLKDIFDSFSSFSSTNQNAKLDDSFLDLYKNVSAIKQHNQQLIKKGEAPILAANETFDSIASRYTKGEFSGINQQIQQLKRPITFRSGTTLGIDGSNNKVSVHKQYSTAELKGMMLSPEGDLILHTNSTFNPRKEGIVKLFSEASKSNLVGTDQFDVAATIGHLLNKDEIKQGLDGKYYFSDSLNFDKPTDIEVTSENINKYVRKVRELEKNQQPISAGDRNLLETLKSRSIILAADDTGMRTFIEAMNLKDPDDVYSFLKDSKNKVSFTAASIDKIRSVVESQNPLNKITSARRTAIIAGMLGNFKGSTDITSTVATNIFTNLDRAHQGKGNKEQMLAVGRMLSELGVISPDQATLKNTDSFSKYVSDYLSNIQNYTDFKKSLAARFKSSVSLQKLSGNSSERAIAIADLSGFTAGLSRYNIQDLMHGNLTTLGNLNTGQAILGIGNKAKMSWTATHQLLSSGLSKDDLKAFGTLDEKLLLELEGIFGERAGPFGNKFNSAAINSKITKSDFADLVNILENHIPEQRLGELKARGIEIGSKSKFITYNLQNRHKGLERLNFSLVTTPRSGSFNKDERNMLKELEGLKLSLLKQDQLLIDSRTPLERQANLKKYEELADRYIKLTNKSLSGENSLLKAAFSRYTDSSSIDLVRGVGGEASQYIEKQMVANKTLANGVFVNSEGLAKRLQSMGLSRSDLVEEKISDNLFKFSYKTSNGDLVPLQALLTREPAQGPLSSTLEDIILDKSITSKNPHTYIPENHFAHIVGKYMDYDQDTLQALMVKYSSKEQANSINSKFKVIGEQLQDLVAMHSHLKVKSKATTAYTPFDFESYSDAAAFKSAAAAQGRERKVLAAPSTSIAVDLSEALTLQFGEGNAKATRGRFLAHALVENLIKSAHIETSKYQQQTESDIEKLTRLKKEFLQTGDKKRYADAIRPIYKSQLNMSDTSNTPEHVVKTMEEVIEDMVKAETEQAKVLSTRATSPLNVTTPRAGSSVVDRAIEASESFLEVNKEFDLQSSKSYAKLAKEFKLNLGKTLSDNKGILALGLGASVLGGIVGRQGTPVATSGSTDTDRFIRDDPSANLRPARTVPTGIETNKQTRAYVTPKNHTKNKNIEIEGQFVNSIVDPVGATQDLSSAIFGDSIRVARLETQYN